MGVAKTSHLVQRGKKRIITFGDVCTMPTTSFSYTNEKGKNIIIQDILLNYEGTRVMNSDIKK